MLVDDLKANTKYQGYQPSDQYIKWFWEIMYELDDTQKASFLQFVNGTSRVPLQGFKALQGMGGVNKFSIHKAFNTSQLPTSHTWYT